MPNRHRWVKLRIHVYICWMCGTGKVNALRGGRWETTYHQPDGTSVVSAHVPACARGPLSEKYLAHYADVLQEPLCGSRAKEAEA